MKKIYLSLVALSVGVFASAQTNLSFETWATGVPDSWDYFGAGVHMNSFSMVGDVEDGNGNPVTPSVEVTTGATDGNSYIKMTSFELLNSSQPGQFPDGPYGSLNYQTWASADRYEDLTFDVKYDLQGSDVAVFVVQGLDANGDVVGQGVADFTGTQASFAPETVTISYLSSDAIQDWEIIMSSSVAEVFNTWNGNPAPTQVPTSELDVDNIVLGATITQAPNVSNVVASDISDNGDGTDLETTFDIPTDETDVSNYYAVTFESGEENLIGQLADPLAFVQANAIQIAPNGNNQSLTFTAADEAYRLNGAGNALESDPITENVAYVVVIYVEGANGADDVWSFSNEVTLTSAGTSTISENWKENFNVYPNPAQTNITFDFAGSNEVGALKIMNTNGAIVKNVTVNGSGLVNVNVSDLASGLYIYQVVSNEGEAVITNKFMKK